MAKTAKLYRNVGIVTFNGGETSWQYLLLSVSGVNQFYIGNPNFHSSTDITVTSTHYVGNYISKRNNNYNTVYTYSAGIAFNDNRFTTVDDWRNWLTANPVTVYYKLATPVITDIDYEAVLTYYPQTTIYTTATVQPTLDGKFRVTEI